MGEIYKSSCSLNILIEAKIDETPNSLQVPPVIDIGCFNQFALSYVVGREMVKAFSNEYC